MPVESAADVAAAGIADVDFAVAGVDVADAVPSSCGHLHTYCPVGSRTALADVVAIVVVSDGAAGTAPDVDADAVVAASAVDADDDEIAPDVDAGLVVAASAVDAEDGRAAPDVAGAEAAVDARASVSKWQLSAAPSPLPPPPSLPFPSPPVSSSLPPFRSSPTSSSLLTSPSS